jgi:hypothetical protein
MIWNAPFAPSKCMIVGSVGGKTGIATYCAMDDVWPIMNGGFSSLMGLQPWKDAYSRFLPNSGDAFVKRPETATKSNSIAISSVIGHWPISLR